MNFAVRITTASRTTGDVTARMTVETTPTRSIAVSRSHLSEHNKAFSTLVFVLNCFNCQETLGGIFRGQFRRLFEDFFLSVCLPFVCSLLILPTLPQRKINYLYVLCHVILYLYSKAICALHTTVCSYHRLSNLKKDKKQEWGKNVT